MFIIIASVVLSILYLKRKIHEIRTRDDVPEFDTSLDDENDDDDSSYSYSYYTYTYTYTTVSDNDSNSYDDYDNVYSESYYSDFTYGED